MARVRAGVQMPIIPEDFEPSADVLLSDLIVSCLEESDRACQDEMCAIEWAIVESLYGQGSGN